MAYVFDLFTTSIPAFEIKTVKENINARNILYIYINCFLV